MNSRIIILIIIFTGISILRDAGTATAHEQEKIDNIIIDTDMGLDDVRTIFALLAADNIDIHGIITVEGSAAVGAGTDNLAGLLESYGRGDIPILRGSPRRELEAPPWRETANGLAGGSFPPPRHASVQPATPDAIAAILTSDHDINYLVLGPLTNLASLVTEHRGEFPGGVIIWIPAALNPDGVVEGWNLTWDAASTETVFREAPEMVILDLAGADSTNAADLLASVDGKSPAGRWISRTAGADAGTGQHTFLYDDLAAAALIEPELVKLGGERYRAAVDMKGTVALQLHRDGNIRVARLLDADRCAHLLLSLWNKEKHTHGSILGGDAEESIPAEKYLKNFHGHLGPYVVLGYRMGRAALEATGSAGHFGISAEVHSILEPPPSCLIDGVQLGSGCTLGKRNITIKETTGPAYAVFTTSSGTAVRISLKHEIPDLVSRLIDERGVEDAGRELLGMPASELFDIDISKITEKR